MEQLERWIYGFIIILGGVFLLIYAGVSLIDLISKTIFYFLLIFAIIVMLYGIFLILVGILLMTVDSRVKKSAALIVFLIGMIIIVLAISVILLDSFTNVNVIEILSGIGLIFLGIRLFFPKVKLEYEEKKERSSTSFGPELFIIGLIISSYFGLIFILIMVSYDLEYVLYQLPLVVPPFLVGIFILIYGIYSEKILRGPHESKNAAVLPILRGIIILLIFLSILFTFLFTRLSFDI